MKKILYLGLLLFFVMLAACGESPKQLFETAEFEVLQRNYPHATKLYQEIIDKHPKSEFVDKARKGLDEIKKIQNQTEIESK